MLVLVRGIMDGMHDIQNMISQIPTCPVGASFWIPSAISANLSIDRFVPGLKAAELHAILWLKPATILLYLQTH